MTGTTRRASLRAFARSLKVEHSAVVRAVQAGRLRESIGRDAKGRPFVADVNVARAEWAAGTRKGPSLADEQRQLTRSRRELIDLSVRRRRGELVELAAVEREQFEIARTVRENLLNIPDRVAAAIAAERDPRKVHAMLRAEIVAALEALADELEAAP